MAEIGTRQPRSLSVAFLKPVTGQDMLADAIEALERTRDNIDKVYFDGQSGNSINVMNAATGTGSLKVLCDFISQPLTEKKDP